MHSCIYVCMWISLRVGFYMFPQKRTLGQQIAVMFALFQSPIICPLQEKWPHPNNECKFSIITIPHSCHPHSNDDDGWCPQNLSSQETKVPQILIVLIIMVVHFPMKSIILVILTLTCIAMECYGKSPLKQYVNHHFYIFLSSINAPSIHIYTIAMWNYQRVIPHVETPQTIARLLFANLSIAAGVILIDQRLGLIPWQKSPKSCEAVRPHSFSGSISLSG